MTAARIVRALPTSGVNPQLRKELRFGMIGDPGEQRAELVPITDHHVVTEYFRQSGGADAGLYVHDSLKEWRNTGWDIDGRHLTIQGYTRLDPRDHEQVCRAIYYHTGVGIGFRVATYVVPAFERGETWDVSPGVYGITGGHYVWVGGYDADGLTCVTWGGRQRMTWAFWDMFCDEAWAIFGHRSDGVDWDALDAMVREVTEG